MLVSASGPKLLKLSLSFNFLTCKMGRINNTSPVRLCSEIHFKYLHLFGPFLSFLSLPLKHPNMHTHASKLTNRLYLLAGPLCVHLWDPLSSEQRKLIQTLLTLSNLLVRCRPRARPWLTLHAVLLLG